MSQTASHQATLTVNTSAPIVSSQQPNTGADVKITVSNAAFPAGSSSVARSARSSAPLHVMATACLRGDASFVYTDGNPLVNPTPSAVSATGSDAASIPPTRLVVVRSLAGGAFGINWASLLRKLRAIKEKPPRTSIFAPGFFTSA